VGTDDHRVLYLTVCASCPAAGGEAQWAVGRAQFPDPHSRAAAIVAAQAKPAKPAAAALTTTDWGVDAADDWGDAADDAVWSSAATAAAVPADETPPIEAVSLSDAPAPPASLPQVVMGEDHPARFACHYLNVVPEPATQPKLAGDFSHEEKLLQQYVASGGSVPAAATAATAEKAAAAAAKGGASSSEAKESYEKVAPKHGDLSFYRFQKRVSRMPEQCLRYSVGDSPLMVSDRGAPPLPSSATIPPCTDCGAPRQPEMQLLPSFLCHLVLAVEGFGELPSFGTVVVCTCSRHCRGDRAPGTIQPEFVFVQPDPDDATLRAAGVV
jgi:hypothetical protein